MSCEITVARAGYPSDDNRESGFRHLSMTNPAFVAMAMRTVREVLAEPET